MLPLTSRASFLSVLISELIFKATIFVQVPIKNNIRIYSFNHVCHPMLWTVSKFMQHCSI